MTPQPALGRAGAPELPAAAAPRAPRRRAILDLAPLELDCLNALWPLGEATVRQVYQHMQRTKPRAYTTIMTILDRMAAKGIVSRRKRGRTWLYTPNLSADQARSLALERLVECFFAGSTASLLSHLRRSPRRTFREGEPPRPTPTSQAPASDAPAPMAPPLSQVTPQPGPAASDSPSPFLPRLDDSLL